MATVVRHTKTERDYILLGAGVAMWARGQASPWFGDRIPKIEGGTVEAVAVCDENGQIGFVPVEEVVVISVDGRSPGAFL